MYMGKGYKVKAEKGKKLKNIIKKFQKKFAGNSIFSFFPSPFLTKNTPLKYDSLNLNISSFFSFSLSCKKIPTKISFS